MTKEQRTKLINALHDVALHDEVICRLSAEISAIAGRASEKVFNVRAISNDKEDAERLSYLTECIETHFKARADERSKACELMIMCTKINDKRIALSIIDSGARCM